MRVTGLSGWLRRLGLSITDMLGSLFAFFGDLFERILPQRRSAEEGSRWPLRIATALILVFIAAPTFILLPASFSANAYLTWPPQGFSTEWYATFLTTPIWVEALVRSVVVGVTAATLAMALGIPAAYVLGNRQFPGKSAILTVVLIPVVLPSIIIAVGLFYLYSHIGLLQTPAALILGHTVFALPYVVITVMATLRSYDHRLDQAAWTLGASKLTAFRLISLPLMKTGMATAFLFGFVQSFDDLSVALFVASPTAPTLPRQLWSEALYRLSPTLAAASVVMILIVAVPIILSQLIGRRIRTGAASRA
jgi:putative spermidine/putrescine transport system permease protein